MVESTTPGGKQVFVPGKLPNNSLALKNMLYLTPESFKMFFEENGQRQPVFVKAKNMVMRLSSDDRIEKGEVGMSSLQKEALRLSNKNTI